jgi:hypothetical protein
MPSIEPKNVTAQILHRARGNPPSTTVATAISNCFPGLEFDIRSLLRRMFVGVLLHESLPFVVGVEPSGPQELAGSPDWLLVEVEGIQLIGNITGPRQPNGPSEQLGAFGLERFNALAPIFRSVGQRVRCVFVNTESNQQLEFNLEVRAILERRPNGQGQQETGPALSKDIVAPGDLTQGLCSPWSADFLECGCYYWAASRPDLVNAQAGADGKIDGHNWLHRGRTATTPPQYSIRSNDLVTYEDLYRDWEGSLKFIVGGKDES